MAEWKEYTVADVISTVIDYRGKTPKKLGGDWSDSGYRALSAKNIKTGKIVQSESIRYVSEDMYRCWMKEEVQKEDILITSEAPFGQIYYWNSDEKIVLSQRLFAVRINQQFYPKYVYFYMTSSFFQAELDGRATGTTVVGLRQPELLKCKIFAPDYQEQKRIADTLWCLEQKINNNEAINNNLEQQMQALFNEYLSSNKFYDLTTVKDVVLSANTGADAIQKAPIVDYDTGIRCIRVGDMTNNRSFHDWGFTKVTDDVFKRYQLHKDDIVVTRTASLGLNTIISKDLPAVYNNGLIRLTVNTSNVLPLYLFRQFQTEDFSNYISCIESETSVRPNMKINYLLKYEFVLPPITKQNEIIALLTPMLNQQNNLIVENKHLEALRDTLLPKLMSGELDVSNIDL